MLFESLKAQVLARERKYQELIALAERDLQENKSAQELQTLANVLLGVGLNTYSAFLFKRAYECDPKNLGPLIGYANSLKDIAQQSEALRVYNALHRALPNNILVWRNLLLSMEYADFVNDRERFEHAKAWGQWIQEFFAEKEITHKSEIFAEPLPEGEPLRVGYLSADLCQHTVGLFLRGVLRHHSDAVKAYTYHAGQMVDGVTREIAEHSIFLQVNGLDDEALAQRIAEDKLHVLVDLSGHTAGSRLQVLTFRLAPLQLSWLGYFSTTGLPQVDGVLLDAWHADAAVDPYFVEPIIRLAHGRLCYSPMEFSPSIADTPCLKKGVVTFGSFNNTAKYCEPVFALWAEILKRLPTSQLVLKWRTFHDPPFCLWIKNKFAKLGVAAERIELRGFSSHDEMLSEYADIDIALDSFPFSGGLTSCEALWMGVPVVTLPGSRVVSRQTHAFLMSIGAGEWTAKSQDHYLQIALNLAADPQGLNRIRHGLRSRMQASPLMDLPGFVSELEQVLRDQLILKLGTYK